MIVATRAVVAVPSGHDTRSLTNGAAEKTAERPVLEMARTARFEKPRAIAVHPLAPFIAQLIATHQALPQTRARNRAGLVDAVSAYRAGSNL